MVDISNRLNLFILTYFRPTGFVKRYGEKSNYGWKCVKHLRTSKMMVDLQNDYIKLKESEVHFKEIASSNVTFQTIESTSSDDYDTSSDDSEEPPLKK
jgi:hypothetical protein